MKRSNLASSVKGLLAAAMVLVLGLLFAPQTQAQTLDNGSALTGVVSKSTVTLLNNVNWVGEQEAIQALMDARAQLEAQVGQASSETEKWSAEIRSNYYWLLAKEIKNGSTVNNAVVNTYDRLGAMCAQVDNLVSPEDVLQDVVTLLSN